MTFIQELEVRGYQARVVSTRRLGDLQEALEGGRKQGLLTEEFYRGWLAELAFGPPDDFRNAQSVIVASSEDPPIRFHFAWQGRQFTLVVPPTYLHWQDKDKKLEKTLAELLGPEGYRVVPASLPKKLLAVRSGLAQYGKNNITYVAGTGSFHRLAAFYSDFQCEDDEWKEPEAMEQCENCLACTQACPTDAICRERFLLRAERCITYWNEKPWQVSFPEWMEGRWHNCLVGCMLCQNVCPENREVINWREEGERFSEEDTDYVLNAVPAAELPAALAEKLRRSDMLEWLSILPRNLRALLHKSSSEKA